MADKTKCEHSVCTCVINDGDVYCSPQCETDAALDLAVLECECDHSTCESSVVRVRTAEA